MGMWKLDRDKLLIQLIPQPMNSKVTIINCDIMKQDYTSRRYGGKPGDEIFLNGFISMKTIDIQDIDGSGLKLAVRVEKSRSNELGLGKIRIQISAQILIYRRSFIHTIMRVTGPGINSEKCRRSTE